MQTNDETDSNSGENFAIMSNMGLNETELLRWRIENELVALGDFSAEDLVENAANQVDFRDVEPRHTQGAVGTAEQSDTGV